MASSVPLLPFCMLDARTVETIKSDNATMVKNSMEELELNDMKGDADKIGKKILAAYAKIDKAVEKEEKAVEKLTQAEDTQAVGNLEAEIESAREEFAAAEKSVHSIYQKLRLKMYQLGYGSLDDEGYTKNDEIAKALTAARDSSSEEVREAQHKYAQKLIRKHVQSEAAKLRERRKALQRC